MTCIVALTDGDRVLVGGDSASVGNGQIRVLATRKVFQIGSYAIGYTTSWRMGQILRHETDLPDPDDADDGEALEDFLVSRLIPVIRRSFEEHGFAKTLRVSLSATHTEDGQEISGIFVLGIRGHVFEIRYDYQVVRPVTPYTAVEYYPTRQQAIRRLAKLKLPERVALVDRQTGLIQCSRALYRLVIGNFGKTKQHQQNSSGPRRSDI